MKHPSRRSVDQSPRRHHPAQRVSGVTLIELVVTVSVVSILTFIAAPSFKQVIAENRVSGVANELSAALSLARSESIKRGKRVTVCKSSNLTDTVTATTPACSPTGTAPWPDGWLVFVDEGVTGVRDGTVDTLIQVGQPSSRNLVQAADANVDDYVSYSPSPSGLIDAAGSFSVCVSPADPRTIEINAMGRTRVERVNGGACP